LASGAGAASNPRPIPWSALAEIRHKIQQRKAGQAAFEAAHGKSRPIITLEAFDNRFTAVGNEIHFSPIETTKYFPDFLTRYVKRVLTQTWGNAEIAKPLPERHQILKWYESVCHYERRQKRDADGAYRRVPSGAMLSWYRFAYDLYLIKHNAKLQKRILDRIRSKDHFQGARFELCVTAAMVVAGFQIDFEDETDTSRKHPEFIAKHPSGISVAVEAKSRHRHGVLGFELPGGTVTDKVAVEGLLRNALAKDCNVPYFIFIDVNVPPTTEVAEGNPWFKEMSDTVKNLYQEWDNGTFPANAVYFCSDPSHYVPDEVLKGPPFWCYEMPIKEPRYLLPDPELSMRVAQALIQRTNIPNEFPSW